MELYPPEFSSYDEYEEYLEGLSDEEFKQYIDERTQELIESGPILNPETAYTEPTNPNVFENTDPIPSSEWASGGTGGRVQVDPSTISDGGGGDHSGLIIG